MLGGSQLGVPFLRLWDLRQLRDTAVGGGTVGQPGWGGYSPAGHSSGADLRESHHSAPLLVALPHWFPVAWLLAFALC